MSYAYRIKLDTLSSQVHQTGEWSLSLLDLLPSEEMSALLVDTMRSQGWSQDDDGMFLELEGLRCELDLSELKIVTSLSDKVSIEHTVVADSDDSHELRQSRIEQGQKEQERALTRATESKNRELTARLMQIEPLILDHINLLSHHTHAEALKIKASQLGEIVSTQEISDDEGALELTIHIKLS